MSPDYYETHYPSLVKQAGFWSELGSVANPLNWIGPGHIGMLSALATPTRNLREQATSNIDDTWSNLLIPGKGPYNATKRLGWSIRGPELEAARAAAEAKGSKEPEDDGPQHPGDPGFEDKLKQHMDDNNLKYSAAKDLLKCATALTKQGGYWTEMLSNFNPVNAYVGTPIGAVAAGLTPTRNIKELGEQDTGSWSNMLLPGVGPFRYMKRLGTSIRGPEMKDMEEQIKRERAEDSSGTKRLSDNLQGIRDAIEAGAPGSLSKLQASGQEKEKAAALLLKCANFFVKQAQPPLTPNLGGLGKASFFGPYLQALQKQYKENQPPPAWKQKGHWNANYKENPNVNNPGHPTYGSTAASSRASRTNALPGGYLTSSGEKQLAAALPPRPAANVAQPAAQPAAAVAGR